MDSELRVLLKGTCQSSIKSGLPARSTAASVRGNVVCGGGNFVCGGGNNRQVRLLAMARTPPVTARTNVRYPPRKVRRCS